MKTLLKTKLFFLKVLYSLCDILSNSRIANKFFARSKLYFGTATISLSVIISSCNQRSNVSKMKTDGKDTIIRPTVMCYERTVDSDNIYPKTDTLTIAEQMPEFKGGNKALLLFLSKNLIYPEVSTNQASSNKVYVSFVINKDGDIINPKIMRSPDPALDVEVLRVIKLMPKWIPGKQNGIPVNVRYTLPISFNLK